ncbi:MAG: hypothetical protein IJ769_00060 [Clostridia bacterium]|nr:hypothetical protein [Clostridia bacterium]
MATHAIGNLKFNLSDNGFAWRMGDGKIHRLFGGKRNSAEDEYVENMEADGETGYQDAYDAQDGDYADDYEYDDRDDGDYADGDYDDAGYEDDRYDDDYADDDRYDEVDDGYYDDDGYADDDYDDRDYDGGYDDDYDGDYDDRYQDVDADDYDDEGGYDEEQSGLMRYVDENDWVTYVLLFLFPPLGIYLLWRRSRFEKPLRWGLTAASAIWFVVALILLLRGLFGGTGDQLTQPSITIPPAQVEVTVAPTAGVSDITSIDLGGGDIVEDEPIGGDDGSTDAVEDVADDATASGLTDDGMDVQPTATPLASSANGASSTTANYVWSPASGLYYHAVNTCPSIEEGVQVWQVTKEIAENSRHQSPCPDCIGGGTTTTYYARADGKYYHSDSTCSSMKNAQIYTLEAAQNEGKEPCPVCILKTQKVLGESVNSTAVFISSSTTDKSGIEVYATQGGSNFHVKSDCRGMQGASKISLKDAILAGKTACSTCCPSAGTLVYCREDSKSYHIDQNCQGMKNAKQITLAEAMVMGKDKCSVCIGNGSAASASISENTSGTNSGSTVSLTSATGDKVKVYATQNGKYYHTNSVCSGMKDAQLYTLKAMLQAGKKACPTCASSANTKVYAEKGGKYYHSYATCSDMKSASSGTLAEALAAGLKRCPKCWDKSGNAVKSTTSTQSASAKSSGAATTTSASTASSTAKNTVAASKATASNTYVYATREGSYYHLNSGCGGMTGASRVTLKKAINAGKKACPICASSANRTVYSTSKGDHYHAASVCVPSGMKNGAKRKLSEALMLGQTACPYCLSSKKAAEAAQDTAKAVQKAVTTASRQSTTYKSGKSGVRVYASLTGKYYHTKSSCPNLSGTANRVTLETALNYGKTACPECASSAKRTVYATKGGKYYHYSKADAGSGAKKGTLASALAYGLDPCPNCVTRTASDAAETTYRSGTSGIKVYATLGSKYYHANSTCSGLTGASRVSLETALNYGKKACPVCLASANRKVYAVTGGSYYHYSKAHAGSGATAGTLAEARAYGLKACPICTKLAAGAESYDNGGAADAPVSTVEYGGAADSSVYIDIGSANNYYHKAAKCSDAKFSGGTKVTLQYAIDWDYKACPYCKPPTYVILESTET